jgi:hypothetical protein
MPNEADLQQPIAEQPLDAIQLLENSSIPNGFNFETERAITLNINDATPFVKYEVFAYSNKYSSEAENISVALNNLLYAGTPYNGNIIQVLSLPSIYDKVYISIKD